MSSKETPTRGRGRARGRRKAPAFQQKGRGLLNSPEVEVGQCTQGRPPSGGLGDAVPEQFDPPEPNSPFVSTCATSVVTTPSSAAFPYSNEGSIGSAGKDSDSSLSYYYVYVYFG